MATYRVPDYAADSVTRTVERDDTTSAPGSEANSRRGSVSTAAAPVMIVDHPAGTLAEPPTSVPSPDVPVLPIGPNKEANVFAVPKKQVVVVQHPEEDHAPWSRGKKICCGVCVVLLGLLVLAGVLIAFLVRVPSIEYQSVQVICPGNDYIQCAQKMIQLDVSLSVSNPNIIGATINADLKLFKQDGTLLGPGTIQDTYVSARADTTLHALFNITSSNGYDILIALFLQNQAVTVTVDGTVYVHVGALRPSVNFNRDITIPPQSLSNTASSVIGGLGLSSPSDVEGALASEAPAAIAAVGDAIPKDIGSQVASGIGVPSSISNFIPDLPGSSGNSSIPTSVAGIDLPDGLNAQPTEQQGQQATGQEQSGMGKSAVHSNPMSLHVQRAGPMDSSRFAEVLLVVGPPGSERRRQFEQRRRSQPIAQSLERTKRSRLMRFKNLATSIQRKQ